MEGRLRAYPPPPLLAYLKNCQIQKKIETLDPPENSCV